MWIKICGNTNVEDALLAAEFGADAVGFVFAESSRRVTSAHVAEIVSQLPGTVETIGVFSSCDAEEIATIVRQTGITGVQLHGGFDLEVARRLKARLGESVAVIQVLHWPVDHGAIDTGEFIARLKSLGEEPSVHRILIDAKTKSASGGTGESFDWVAAHAALGDASEMKLIVAGGLHPGNVARAVAELHPWGVDVASGVEASKGRKDPLKLKAFIDGGKKASSGFPP